MPINSIKFLFTSLLLILIGVITFKYTIQNNDSKHKIEYSTVKDKSALKNNSKRSNEAGRYQKTLTIPEYVYPVLDHVKKFNIAPEGYVGGREFKNREHILDSKTINGKVIKYQEWDVYPKVQGRNRGRERLVTGDDDRAWFTADHYKTFTEIK